MLELVQTRRAKEQLESGELIRLSGPICITRAARARLIAPAANQSAQVEIIVAGVRQAWEEGWTICGSGVVPSPVGRLFPDSYLIQVEPYDADTVVLVVFTEDEWRDE